MTGHFPPVQQCRYQMSPSEASTRVEWTEVENRNCSLSSLDLGKTEARKNQRQNTIGNGLIKKTGMQKIKAHLYSPEHQLLFLKTSFLLVCMGVIDITY